MNDFISLLKNIYTRSPGPEIDTHMHVSLRVHITMDLRSLSLLFNIQKWGGWYHNFGDIDIAWHLH